MVSYCVPGYIRHSGGFDVFLPPEQLACSDEYAQGDPYGVDRELKSPFHRARADTAEALSVTALEGKERPALLDLGCGGGHLLARLGARMPGAELVGLDYALSAILEARQVLPRAQLVVADALQAPFSDGSFDLVLCTNLWEHVDNPIGLGRTIRRLLKPGGQLVLSTPSRYRFDNLRRALRGRELGFMSRMHVTEYSVGQVKEMLRFTGFDVLEVAAPSITKHFSRWPRRVLTRAIAATLHSLKSHHVLEPTIFVRAARSG